LLTSPPTHTHTLVDSFGLRVMVLTSYETDFVIKIEPQKVCVWG
jgi:hypothetical protein